MAFIDKETMGGIFPHLERIPIVVGITGHRDLAASEQARAAGTFARILRELRRGLPDTPIWVLSALAEGADQVAAETAIRLRDSRDPAERIDDLVVIAPLPLPPELYEADFDDPEVLEKFRALSNAGPGGADLTFPLSPYEYWSGSGSADPRRLLDEQEAAKRGVGRYPPERTAQYANLGAFLVRYSNVLVAFWDGRLLKGKSGGTGNVVRMMLNGDMDWGPSAPPRPEFAPRSLVSGGEYGAVLHVPVKRKSGTGEPLIYNYEKDFELTRHPFLQPDGRDWKTYYSLPADMLLQQAEPGELSMRQALQDIDKFQCEEFSSSLERIESFNRDLRRLMRKRPPRPRNYEPYLPWKPVSARKPAEAPGTSPKPEQELAEPPESWFECNSGAIAKLFSSADRLAVASQKSALGLTLALFGGVSAMAFGYDLFSGVPSEQLRLAGIIIFLASACIVAALFVVQRHLHPQQRQCEARVLAEMLRIYYYMHRAGLERKLGEVYSAETRQRTAWIDHARRCADLFTWRDASGDPAPCRDDLRLMTNWVDDQTRYFHTKVHGNTSRSWLSGRFGLTAKLRVGSGLAAASYLLGLTLLGAIAALFFVRGSAWTAYAGVPALAFALAAAVQQWISTRSWEGDTERYTIMHDIYRRAAVELKLGIRQGDANVADDDADERRIRAYVTLAHEALAEHIRWFESHRRSGIRPG